LGHGISDSRPV